jgi:CubicO group peptidase (beta-lactamase class C family)
MLRILKAPWRAVALLDGVADPRLKLTLSIGSQGGRSSATACASGGKLLISTERSVSTWGNSMITRRETVGSLLVGAAMYGGAAFAAPEYWPTLTSWDAVEPSAAGFDPQKLNAALDAAMADRSSDVVLLRGGKIVAERYAADGNVDRKQQIASAAKSMVSVLVGVCLDQGKIKSVDQSAADFIAQWRGTPKAAITIRHLLTMTSGLNDKGLALRGITGDQFAINAAAPQMAPPGTRWAYQTAMFHLLYHVVSHAAGESFEAFATRNLTGPLGMQHTDWVTSAGQGANGPVTNYYTAACSGRDLARFGLMALRGGRWAGKPVVSAGYLKQATAPSQDLNPAYGFLWWENAKAGYGAEEAVAGTADLRFDGSPRDTFAALGAGVQAVLVVPSLDLVVVRQGQPPGPKMLSALLASTCAAIRRPA